MKIKSLIYTGLASVLLFTSCDLNKQPVFDDETQAFIAFSTASVNVDEAVAGKAQTLELELSCASVAGINAEVTLSFSNENYSEDLRAVEGVHYVLKSEKTVKFDKDNRFATVIIETIDNNEQGGDKKFDIVLTDAKGCNLGANRVLAVTISDDEDPLNMLVGTYAATAASAFQGEPDENWDVTLSRDEEDETMFWIHPLCLFGGLGASSINPVYAVVDVNSSTLQVPHGQVMYGGEGQTYHMVNAGVGNEPILQGSTVAVYDMSNGVVIEFQNGYGVGDLIANAWWYQAINAPTFVKK